MNKLANFNFCEETLKLKSNIEEGFLELGKRLMTIRDGEMYKGQWQDFPEFLADMRLSEGAASKLINIYKKFVVEYNFPQESLAIAGVGNLGNVLARVSDKESAAHWLHLASTLSREDLAKEIKESKTGILMATCMSHDYYALRVCRTCGDKVKLYEGNIV